MPPSESRSRPGLTRVLLVDDHALLRQGMAAIINEEPDLIVCGEADGVAAALQSRPRRSRTWRIDRSFHSRWRRTGIASGHAQSISRDSHARTLDVPTRNGLRGACSSRVPELM